MILVGDIGGTNTRLALFEMSGEFKVIVEKKFPSHAYSGLEEIATLFLQEQKTIIKSACFAIAGPVREGVVHPPNLSWVVDAAKLRQALRISQVTLLNDLQANANGLKVLKPEELFLVQKGTKQAGNQALLSPGTGLGEAGLIWDGKNHHPFASEGGHADFAPRNQEEFELLSYLQKKFDHVSFERVISGPGIYSLYQFLKEKNVPSGEVEAAMKQKDPSIVITEFGLSHKDKICSLAIDWFLSLCGAEAGNLALKFLSLGGLFLGGGIAPRYASRFKESPFLPSFLNKGRFKPLLESIPIYIVMNDNTALLGAAAYAREHF